MIKYDLETDTYTEYIKKKLVSFLLSNIHLLDPLGSSYAIKVGGKTSSGCEDVSDSS